ncbi:hypothetical protein ICL81_09620 [Leucobacter sp. cx-328]|uniref:hypothetical protein n=1 Tax=unclassified Leucobacter TaxID=2621730 RepID=UPI00165EAEA6|nr:MULTISPECIES: hypothetical protein [unclassified Leucobacter]MBC9944766.1 hypothetical protein [Leucobacter sp. cx-328]
MKQNPIDPRNASAEDQNPNYRVHFTEPDAGVDEWRLTEVENVLEVIAWADARKLPYQLFVEWPHVRGEVHISLLLER